MRSTTQRGFTSSAEYKHENSCGLFEQNYAIRNEHAELLDEIAAEYGDDVDVGAAGCNACFTSGRPLSAFYIAQIDTSAEDFYLKFDTDTDERDDLPDREEFGKEICRLADALGVKWSWTGDTRKAIHIGKSDTYDEEVTL